MCSYFKLLACVLLCGYTFLWAGEFRLQGRTDKDVAVYAPGEPVKFRVQVFEDDQVVADKKLTWTLSFDGKESETGEEVVGEEGLNLVTQLDHPGFVRLQVKAFEKNGTPLQGYIGGWGPNKIGDIFFDGGASVQPDKLRPADEPEDFDLFWQGMKAKLAKVPMEIERKKVNSPTPGVTLYEVRISCAGAKPVTGFLSIPDGAASNSLPAICTFQGYGVKYPSPPRWVNPNAIVFDVNAHGMPLGKEDAYYDQVKKDLRGYAFDTGENKNRETTYFHDMSLRVLRALKYVKSLPEWNGKDLESNGGSQGGLQGLWGGGLDPDVTVCRNWSPWCCDLGGFQLGRMKGWRPEYSKALAYYDPVFHVRRTQAEIHLVANLGDYVCPPSGVWVVYNEVPHKKKSMEVKQGCTHSYEMKSHMSFTVTPQGVRAVGLKNKD